MAKRGYLNLYVAPEELEELRAMAAAKRYSLSEFVRRLLRLAMPIARTGAIAPKDTGGTVRRPENGAAAA